MRILSIRTSLGPNVYHRLPIITMKIDLQEWAGVSSTGISGFNDRLLAQLPGLKTHTCSIGQPGGFEQRLYRGTYMAHIIEHVALELSKQIGKGVSFGKTRYAGQSGVYTIVTRFESEEGMKECLRIAKDLTEATAKGDLFDCSTRIKKALLLSKKNLFGPSGLSLIRAAERRNIPWRRVGQQSLIELGFGKRIKRLQTAVTSNTGLIAKDIAQNKEVTKQLLKNAFLPVPKAVAVSSIEDLTAAIKKIGFPCAVKPLDANHGNGVSLDITTTTECRAAFLAAKKFSASVLVEEMCLGRDYRVLIIDGQMVAAAERQPPSVTGDGVCSISELISLVNQDVLREEGHGGALTKIKPDPIMMAYLKKQNLNLDTILIAGQKISLRANANLSCGGTAIDVTSQVHPKVGMLCERAVRLVGLDICGVDLICKDISAPDQSTKIIEVNAGPGLRMHLSPSQGRSQPVADKIIEMLYPNEENGRIPILSVTGTNGKTSVTRMLHKIFSGNQRVVGMTNSDGIWIGKEQVFEGDTTGPQSTRAVLSDPTVEVAVLEVARGGLLRSGLGYDWSDVSVVTNISADHLGQDGLQTIKDLIWVKSLVAERVRRGGTLVLNADDENALSLAELKRVNMTQRNLFLYSLSKKNKAIQRHLSRGGSACWTDRDHIFVSALGREICLGQISSIPSTLGGRAEMQISNALAATAAASAAGLNPKTIIAGLYGLSPVSDNRGRFNLYKIRDFYVLLDYGHNEPAYAAMGRTLAQLAGYRKIAIVGLPGDRSDALIQGASRTIAKYFDHVIVKEENDLRGRPKGVTSAQMCKVIASQNTSWQMIADEKNALNWAVQQAQSNTVIVLFYEKLDRALSNLAQYNPIQISNFDLTTASSKENISTQHSMQNVSNA